MKYRTKIVLALTCLAAATSSAAAIVLYHRTRNIIFQELQSNIVSIVATASIFINPETLQEYRSNPTEDSPAYRELRETLIKTLNANKRKDLHSSFVYLFDELKEDYENILIEIDTGTEEQRKEREHEIIRKQTFLAEKALISIGRYKVTKKYYENEFGKWFSAFAPIYDSSGNHIADLGINVRSSNIVRFLRTILIGCLIVLIFVLVLAFTISVLLARKFSRPLADLSNTVKAIGQGNFSAQPTYQGNDEFGQLAQAVSGMAKGLDERQRLKTNLSKYVSKDILDIILKEEEKTKLEGDRKKITILFSDIRKFSSISEQLDPQEVVQTLNQYLEKMFEAIFKYKGTLDKILGDSVMVLFGAPLEDAEQERNAVLCAIEMQKQLKILKENWGKDKKSAIHEIGIAIHTGEAIVGNIGSEKHSEYTAIGQVVNIAHRLERATKQYGQSILVSDASYEAIKNEFEFHPLEKFSSEGIIKDMKVYTLDWEKYLK